jgi:hypothetical protein
MNNNAELYGKLLDKYKFSAGLDPAVRARVMSSRKASLRKVLQRRGAYTFAFGLAISMYIIIKQFGIQASLLTAKIILAASVGVTASALTVSAYVCYKYIAEPASQTVPEQKGSEEIKSEEAARPVITANNPLLLDVPYRIGLQPFKVEGNIAGRSAGITGKISSELVRIEGVDKVVNISRGRDRNYNLMLTGSLNRFGGGYVLSVKLVDLSSSEVIFIDSKTVSSENNIDDAIKTLAVRVCEEAAKKKLK